MAQSGRVQQAAATRGTRLDVSQIGVRCALGLLPNHKEATQYLIGKWVYNVLIICCWNRGEDDFTNQQL